MLLAYLFQIKEPTPIKYAFVALALVNCGLMAWLAWRVRWSFWSAYLITSGVRSVLQKSPLWGVWGEVAWMLLGALWVAAMLRRTNGAIYSMLIGTVFFGLLLLIDPQPWPGGDPARFNVAIYSAMAYCGALVGMVTWEWRKPSAERIIAIAWFAAFLASDAPPGQYFTRGIGVKLAWAVCLCGWISASCRAGSLSVSPGSPANP